MLHGASVMRVPFWFTPSSQVPLILYISARRSLTHFFKVFAAIRMFAIWGGDRKVLVAVLALGLIRPLIITVRLNLNENYSASLLFLL